MIGVTESLNEAIAIPAAGIPPQAVTAGSVNSGGINMANFVRARAVLYIGLFGNNANVYLAAWCSATSDLASPIIVPSSTAPTLTAASSGPSGPGGTTGNSNELATLEVLASQLPAGYKYLYFKVTVDVATTTLCLFVEGVPAYSKPASQFNATVVKQETVVPIV